MTKIDTDPICAKCGLKRSKHNVRHPFVGPSQADIIARLEAAYLDLKEKADALADILTKAMHEHDTADYGYGEENPWTMGEWFDASDAKKLAEYRKATT